MSNQLHHTCITPYVPSASLVVWCMLCKSHSAVEYLSTGFFKMCPKSPCRIATVLSPALGLQWIHAASSLPDHNPACQASPAQHDESNAAWNAHWQQFLSMKKQKPQNSCRHIKPMLMLSISHSQAHPCPCKHAWWLALK